MSKVPVLSSYSVVISGKCCSELASVNHQISRGKQKSKELFVFRSLHTPPGSTVSLLPETQLKESSLKIMIALLSMMFALRRTKI